MFGDPRSEWAPGEPVSQPITFRLWSELGVPWWLTPPPEPIQAPAAEEVGPQREPLVPPDRAEIAYPGTLLEPQSSEPQSSEPQAGAAPAPPSRIHVVQPGQSIWQIARLYGVDPGTLIRLNRIRPPHTLYPGQTLRLPSRLV